MLRFKHALAVTLATPALAIVSLIILLVAQRDTTWGVLEWSLSAVVLLATVGTFVSTFLAGKALREPLDAFATAIDSNDSGVPEVLSDIEDIPVFSGLRKAVERLNEKRIAQIDTPSRLASLLSSMNEAIFVTTPDGAIEFANATAENLLRVPEGALTGRSISEVLENQDAKPLSDSAVARPLEGVLRAAGDAPVFVSFMVSELKTEDGITERLIYAAQNIDDRKRVEQRIRYLARTDPLTKMANRMQFQHYLQQGIARARRSRQYLALLYLDVDRFKDINDTFGHAAGDTTLEIFSQRMLDQLPEGANPGRLAGDEFAILIGGYKTMNEAHEEVSVLTDKLLTAIGQPFQVHGEEVFMTTSIGVALYPRDGDNVIDLIRNSDAALYHAKKAGGNCFQYYSPDMNVESVERLMLKSKLRRAFEHEELRLHYQPKYGLKSGRIEGCEALVRWDQPDHGLLYPSDFIPLAEETNLIIQVGDWVLDKVCADYRRWQRTVPSPCRVSVNLSLRQLQQHRFLEKVRETFQHHSVSPTCLELEITETTLMDDTDKTIRILDSLYGMGLHLAIDDFGTGYSSLSALQQFPINTLKIDRSFVRDVAIDKDDAAIVRTIIQMGHSLGLEVVAEGVESEDQLNFLRDESCDFAQGHLFGDPMTGEEFCAVLLADTEGSGRYRALFG
jgi:diguanylate cyclase (GGDEF)-like protein